jgi:hypothetical protein
LIDGTPDSRTTLVRDLELGGHRQARRETCVSHSGWRAFNACSEENSHQPAPLLAYTLELAVILTARAPNRRRSSERSLDAMTQGRARQTQGRENGHNHFTRHRPRGAAARRRRLLLQTPGVSRKGASVFRGHSSPYDPRPALSRAVVGLDARRPVGAARATSRELAEGQSRSTTLRRELLIFSAPL